MPASVLRIARWILVLPLAASAVPLIDGAVVAGLGVTGVADQSLPWLLGKVVGHGLMGAAAVTIGAWIAPGYQPAVALVLLGMVAMTAMISTLSGALPLPMILPLAIAFVSGAAVVAALVLRRHRDRTDPRLHSLPEHTIH